MDLAKMESITRDSSEMARILRGMDAIEDLKVTIDDFFLIVNGIIISMMQIGFACVEAGSVRAKNSSNIMMKNVLDTLIACVTYYLTGWGIAYGDGNSFIGLTGYLGSLPTKSFAEWFFQCVFATTASTIISGAVAERCNFVTYLAYSSFTTGFMYPMVSHWAWHKDGWLKKLGYTDLAGSGVVHLLAGVSSFVAAKFLGPRIGRFVDGKPVKIPGHNLPLIGVGMLVLNSAFFCYNGGSLGKISPPGNAAIVATIMRNTLAGGSGGVITGFCLGQLGVLNAPWPYSPTMNAILCGYVATCAGADVYPLWGALIVSILASSMYFAMSKLVLRLKVDDPLDACAVHCSGGFVGALMRPIFAEGTGLVFQPSTESLMNVAYALLAIVSIIAWSIVCSVTLFGFMKSIGKLRVSPEDEMKGADVVKHCEESFPRSAWITYPPVPPTESPQQEDNGGGPPPLFLNFPEGPKSTSYSLEARRPNSFRLRNLSIAVESGAADEELPPYFNCNGLYRNTDK